MSEKIEISDADVRFMEMAAEIAEKNIDRGGGPFGAVIVRGAEVVATGANTVTLSNDPTAHAEVNAIREACRRLGTFSLKDCIVYSSCEPCPMCLSALYWAGVKRIYFGNTKELEKPRVDRVLPCIHIESEKNIRAFQKWAAKKDKIEY